MRSKSSKEEQKKICVITNGCPENRIDSATLLELSKENGWIATSDYRKADMVLFNACGLTEDCQNNSVKTINQIQAGKKSSAKLIAYGCLSKINIDRLRDVYQGFTSGSDEIEQISKVIDIKTNPHEAQANYLVPQMQRWDIPSLKKIISHVFISKLLTRIYCSCFNRGVHICTPHTFYIKVSTGCLNTCSYCGVRLSRGTIKSKSMEKVINEFEEGLDKGYAEFALIGTDLGAYGRDRGETLCTLLRELVKRNGNYKIKLRNIQPRFLIDMMSEFLDILRCGKISYIGSAVESGNNRMLKLMNRGYRIEPFKEAILTLKREFPKLQINTQIMICFPSETEEEFNDTVRLLDELDFAFVEVYIFQPRPNTEGEKMNGQISNKVAAGRLRKLLINSFFKKYKLLIW